MVEQWYFRTFDGEWADHVESEGLSMDEFLAMVIRRQNLSRFAKVNGESHGYDLGSVIVISEKEFIIVFHGINGQTTDHFKRW